MANVNGEGEAGFRLQLCRQSTLLRLEDNSQLGSSASGQRSLWEKIKHGPIAPIAPIITVYASSKLCEFIYEQFQTAFDPPIVLAINTDIDIEFLGIYNIGTFGFQQETTIPLNVSKDRERRTGEMAIWWKTLRAKR